MFKKIILALLTTLSMAFMTTHALAATDINKATQAELESIKGIGPSMSTRILDERKKSAFKNWDDVMGRVKGVKARSAEKFSKDGLTVNGESFKSAGASAGSSTSEAAPARTKAGGKAAKDTSTKS